MIKTGPILKKLRDAMKDTNLISEAVSAYIIPTEDAHQSEYIAECDKRRQFITGFSGSAGTAVVTDTRAALWTDGRYFQAARQQMDDNWELMRMGVVGTPSIEDFLYSELPTGSRIGADPFLFRAETWERMSRHLAGQHHLVASRVNLVDGIWGAGRPPPPANPLLALPVTTTGESWQMKIERVRARMVQKKVAWLVVTALDEIAWLLNLRGSDIDYNPVFFSYMMIAHQTVILFVDRKQITPCVAKHLSAPDGRGVFIPLQLMDYEKIKATLVEAAQAAEGKIWISSESSHALFTAVPLEKRVSQPSPVALMKAVKNPVELMGFRDCHIRDAVAVCQFLHWLEDEVKSGQVTEISAADYLDNCRRKLDQFVSLSFATIAGSGPNGAVIHYRATEATCRPVTTDQMFLVDSGAQYRDGTTDITRTVHLGSASDYERECFTLVLKGHIALSRCVFPRGTKGHRLESFARHDLWSVGLDYQHGTGHGIGHFLNVHEGPCAISWRTRSSESDLEPNMIVTIEPGFYEEGKFGVRHENAVRIVERTTKYNFKGTGFLGFEPITFVPFQTSMLKQELLSEDEISWLNDYHQKCRDLIGPELLARGENQVHNWLLLQTKPLG